MTTLDRLNELMLSYRREARRCIRAKAYLAATVKQVSAFEAGLQSMCLLYPEEVRRTAIYAGKRFRGKNNRALEFSLNQLINIADELGWFPTKLIRWAGKRTTLAGFSHEIRKVRNYVHPAVWAEDRKNPLKFTKGIYGVVDEVIDIANSWLFHRIEKDLFKAIKRREKRMKVAAAASTAP
jgi:hypothetical protein